MKYLVLPDELTGLPAAIMFGDNVSHARVAEAMAPGKQVLGAGFCNQFGEVWGKSDSLGIKAEPCDSAYLRLAMKSHLCPKPENLIRGGAVAARQTHNLEVAGAIPAPVTNSLPGNPAGCKPRETGAVRGKAAPVPISAETHHQERGGADSRRPALSDRGELGEFAHQNPHGLKPKFSDSL